MLVNFTLDTDRLDTEGETASVSLNPDHVAYVAHEDENPNHGYARCQVHLANGRQFFTVYGTVGEVTNALNNGRT